MSQEQTSADAGLLRFKGDWGGANLHRASGWLAQWVYDQTPEHRQSVIYTGRGMGDNLRALANGEVDVAFATAASFAGFARRGVGPFDDGALENLVAIAALPHRDAMIPVARKEFGFTGLADVAAYEGPLRVSLCAGDRDGFMGFAGDAVLALACITEEHIAARGGTVVRHEQPFDAVADLREGRADLMVSEAIMTPDWQELARGGSVDFLSLTEAEAQLLAERWTLGTIDIAPGYFPGIDHPIRALDYSDWIIATTTDLPDADAALLARAIVEDGEYFARGYRHLPVEYSPLRYPIDYRVARRTALPLHPAAAEVYERAAAAAEEEVGR